MNIFSSTLDYFLVYGLVFLISGLFLFSLFEIYYDRKKNLWHIPGPFPLPLVGKIMKLHKILPLLLIEGNSLLFAKPHEEFMPTLNAVSWCLHSFQICTINALLSLFNNCAIF